MTPAEKWYDCSEYLDWKEVPGLIGFYASTLGHVRVGAQRILTARYIVNEGLYVPIRESAVSRADSVYFPVHLLTALTHLPNRPRYSWDEIAGYTTQLVHHRNRDVFDNRVTNLVWAQDPGYWDLEHLMQQPPVPRARPILKKRG